MDYFVSSGSMLNVETEEELIEKAGGKFALTSLLQKRVVELNRGAPPLVEMDPHEKNLRRVACREILEGKISLAPLDEIEYSKAKQSEQIEAAPAEEPKEESSEVYGSDIKKIKEQRIKELAQLLNPKQ